STGAGLITGNFNHQAAGVDGIVLGNAGANCTTQLFRITDGLNSVGTGSQHSGWGTFVGYLWHYRHWVFGRCVTYSATVQGTVTLTDKEILEFGRRYDPQPFHVDPEAARESVFGGLIASGWLTGSLFMRLFTTGVLNKYSSLGSPGLEELRWLRPVRPGDVL